MLMEATNLGAIFSSLITEVHRRQPLWKATHKSYHNRGLIDGLWNEVANQLEIPKEECKKKWKNLRDRYRIELKRYGRIGKSGHIPSSRWPFFKRMEFVGKFMHSAKTLPTDNVDKMEIVKNQMDVHEDSVVVKNEIEIFKNEIELDEDSVVSEKQLFVYAVSELSNASDEVKCKAEKMKFEEDIDDKLYYPKEQMLTTCEYPIDTSNVKESEDLLFFKSLLGYMEKFSPIQKLRVRNQITTVIINELKDSTREETFSSMDNNIPGSNENSVELNDTNGNSNKFFKY